MYHWIWRQRLRYQENDLPEDRKGVLDDIGFPWEAPPKKTVDSDDENSSLGEINDSSSEDGSERAEKTTPNRRRRGCDDEKWLSTLNDLQKYRKKYKTINVSYKLEDQRFLYYWTWRQKKLYRQNKLPEDRVKLLLSIGFDFSRKLPLGTPDGSDKRETQVPVMSLSESSQGSSDSSDTDSDSDSSSSTEYESEGSDRIPISLGKVEGKFAALFLIQVHC